MQNRSKQLRPGGRTERNRKAVATAVLELIRRGDLDFELQEVAALSGVHRTTLFRRWPDRAALIGEALAEHVARISIPFIGDWREDLRQTAFALREFFADPIELAMNRVLVMTESEHFREQMFQHWRATLDGIERPLRDARDRGEIDAKVDVEVVVRGLISMILVQSLFSSSSLDDAYLERIVSQAIRSCTSA